MAYVIAKKYGKNGSVAYTYDSSEIQLISQLEQEYLGCDIDFFITSDLCNKEEFQPVFNVGHFELFIESIKKVLK
ncbi:MAG: hypothetical protein L0L57_06645 [Alkalibacterium sp.]|uniref:DUF6718 family protein n=1 Tax=Alkalibacterium TaxID=99906 RepID=UPI002647924E|nr:DUF6718 family protein [Alkalibacterium sp.]MDN6293389.1 hypothetical protein [Alkalibacterium sp.]MDN6295336.1 hypothetical protein [Alkalibacterium sp.]MDN6729837.1 hypothetical protein [Alkalibacterium sp.]